MEYSKIFNNQAKIVSRLNTGSYSEMAGNFTIRFVFDGNETCTIGRRHLAIHNDSFIVLNKDTQFSVCADKSQPVHVFSIEFDPGFLNAFELSGINEYNFAINGQYELAETIYPLRLNMRIAINQLKWYLDNGGDDHDIIDEHLTQCLALYCQIYNEEILQKATRLNFLHHNTRIEILRRLNLAKEYLYVNYNRNVNLENLADHSCLSVNHLLRTFKLAYNQSPHQFLIQLRLQRAQLLLTKTEYPVYEIVNMVGFKCTSSFIRLFRTRYKTTPLKYRNVIAA